jgi:hypothetical protein
MPLKSTLKPRSRPSFVGADLILRRSLAYLVRRDMSGPVTIFHVIDIKATRNARALQISRQGESMITALCGLNLPI